MSHGHKMECSTHKLWCDLIKYWNCNILFGNHQFTEIDRNSFWTRSRWFWRRNTIDRDCGETGRNIVMENVWSNYICWILWSEPSVLWNWTQKCWKFWHANLVKWFCRSLVFANAKKNEQNFDYIRSSFIEASLNFFS